MKKLIYSCVIIVATSLVACSDSATTKTSTSADSTVVEKKPDNTRVEGNETTTAPVAPEKKTEIVVGKDGAGVSTKSTDVNVNKDGINVGTKDVKVEIKK